MARTVTRPTLTDVLVRQGILPKQTLDQVLSRLGGVTAAFGQTLVSEGILSEDQLARALAAQTLGPGGRALAAATPGAAKNVRLPHLRSLLDRGAAPTPDPT